MKRVVIRFSDTRYATEQQRFHMINIFISLLCQVTKSYQNLNTATINLVYFHTWRLQMSKV